MIDRELFQNSSGNLSAQIKKVITSRIFICFLLAIFVVFIVTGNAILTSWSQLNTNLESQCKSVESFIISQTLVQNISAIQPKLSSLNKDSIKFIWSSTKSISSQQLVWHFPFGWAYDYPVKYIDGTVLGNIIVKGSVLYDRGLFNTLLTNIALLTIFFIIIFVVLYPLAHSIPERLFIGP